MQAVRFVRDALVQCCRCPEPEADPSVTQPLLGVRSAVASPARPRPGSLPTVSSPVLTDRAIQPVPTCLGSAPTLATLPSLSMSVEASAQQRESKTEWPLDGKQAPAPDTHDLHQVCDDDTGLRAWIAEGDVLVQTWEDQGAGRITDLTRLLAAAEEAGEADRREMARCILQWLPRLMAPVMRHDFSDREGKGLTASEQASAFEVWQALLAALKLDSVEKVPIHQSMVEVMVDDPQGPSLLGPVLKATQYVQRDPARFGGASYAGKQGALRDLHGKLYRQLQHQSRTGCWNSEKHAMAVMLRDVAAADRSSRWIRSTIPLGALKELLATHDLPLRQEAVVTALVAVCVPKDLAALVASYLSVQEAPARFDWRLPIGGPSSVSAASTQRTG